MNLDDNSFSTGGLNVQADEMVLTSLCLCCLDRNVTDSQLGRNDGCQLNIYPNTYGACRDWAAQAIPGDLAKKCWQVEHLLGANIARVMLSYRTEFCHYCKGTFGDLLV